MKLILQLIILIACFSCQKDKAPGVPCPDFYDPVCGADGKTYTNECVAQSKGITSFTKGKCP